MVNEMKKYMNQLKVAVCDDDEYYREDLEKLISVYGNEYNTDIRIDKYEKMLDLVDAMANDNTLYDMLFLDIEMPDCSGIDGAKIIRKRNKDVVICFITNHAGFALSAFDVDAIGYVVKPVKYYDIKKQLERGRIISEYNKNIEEAQKKFITVSAARKDIIIELDKVVYIEKRRNQCVFHLNDGEIVCYDTLKNVYNKLNKDKFLYTHQGYIANFDYIKEVKANVVCFGDDMEIPISRKYYNNVRKRHLNKIFRLRNSNTDW